jgi:hypothetical protein
MVSPASRYALRNAAAIVLGLAATVMAAPNALAASTRDPGALCVVDLQWNMPAACPEYGPAARRTEFWESGLLPRRPFPSQPLDKTLAELDRSYAKVDPHMELPVFKTLDDAVRNNEDHHLDPGFVYISYKNIIERGHQEFLETGGGWYIRKEDVSFNHIEENQFHGFTLTAPPPHPFGWVVAPDGITPSNAPGGSAGSGVRLPFYKFVEVFASQTVRGSQWFEVGLNQWLPLNQLALVFPAATLPAGIPDGARWISINLGEQTLAAYEGTRLVFATLASTGVKDFWTRPGLFQVKNKYDLQSMSGAFRQDRSDFYFVQDVPFILYFSSSRAIHGAYWHNAFGYPRSHGCVNLPVADAHWVFDFSSVGTWVSVFDPTGKTPMNDASYPWEDGLAP